MPKEWPGWHHLQGRQKQLTDHGWTGHGLSSPSPTLSTFSFLLPLLFPLPLLLLFPLLIKNNFTYVTRVYVPWFFVSSQQRFKATDIKSLCASQLSGLGQTLLQLLGKSMLQLHFIYKIAGEREDERERERKEHTHAGERVREKALWLLLLYVFSSTWACPM